VRAEFDLQFWEYPWFVCITIFLLAVGFFLLVFGLVAWIFGRFRRPRLSWGIIIASALLAGILTSGYIFYQYTSSNDLGNRVVVVTVESGDSFVSVADRLVKQGVVDTRWTVVYPARLLKIDRKLLPGNYLFTGSNSARSVLDKFARGDVQLTEVTIPEGMPIWKVASVLHQKLELDSAELIQLSRDRQFLDSLAIPYLEGHLFPETYSFGPGITLRSVVREMVRMYQTKTDSVWQRTLTNGLNQYQSLILASIIEAETPLASERSRVASVYLNRLRIGMTLDADPTVIYGLGGLERPLLLKDLDSVTLYNTYRTAGLPPTPINSPGLASIMAALNPDGSDYLYFVADGSGGHIFSRTNEEHNMARRRARLNDRH
jgi:UPF0755 protein